ncbi:uncharacterized protein MELLADRAFT_115117 [Melampsora larici-populina 98AG31]|uniref:C2 NT-type domain-containing protein n=1 Tax=Melampsora larici-populina (strain 98AG31 / pathotype 3-4-7) TaxID=747676 RepID=F4R5I2_MELLP|nr:uncharacterized protein MELLADRAFT_115117 [Melampsora larici-populina 98AG31]EGG12053.1 hypothetical protein MELLADRAFT_115117 [Melampsora larici-populina 98AG31]
MDALQRALNLNRTVNFDCTITVDQLVNVPLLNGKFKLKWKFAHPITTVHLEAQLKAKHVATTITHRLAMSDDESHLPQNLLRSSQPHHSSFGIIQNSQQDEGSAHHSYQAGPSGANLPDLSNTRSSIMGRGRSLTQSTYLPSHYPSNDPQPGYVTDLGAHEMPGSNAPGTTYTFKDSAHSRFGSPSIITPDATPTLNNSIFGSEDGYKLNSVTPRPGYNPNPTTPNSQMIEAPCKAESSGSTPYVDVKNHSAVFRQAFRCPVSIAVTKEGRLQPSILTIVVKQEHVGEDGRREVSRHGTVAIDLSRFTPFMAQDVKEQVIIGEHELEAQKKRRVEKTKFLLQECRTNASLKLQIQMDYLSGATSYKTSAAGSPISDHAHSPHEDAKSVYSIAKSSSGSPDSSILSSNSSYHNPSGALKKVQISPSTYHMGERSSHSSGHRARPFKSHQHETTLQVADELIDVLFSNAYVPSSGPVTQRLQSAKRKKERTEKLVTTHDAKSLHLSIRSSQTNKSSAPRPTMMSVWENSIFLKPREEDDDAASRKSGKSFQSKFRSLSRLTALHSTS